MKSKVLICFSFFLILVIVVIFSQSLPSNTVNLLFLNKSEAKTHAAYSLVQAEKAWESVTLPSGKIAHLGDPATISQVKGATEARHQSNVVFILDASGSMKANLPGTGKSKLTVAKEVLSQLLPQIPVKVNTSLWVYGHRYPQEPKEKSCQDIEQLFKLGTVDATSYIQKINAITGIGYTPIAATIEQAAKELPPDEFNNIILLSDGEETCGGDPCALAKALKISDTKITTHVIAYAVKDAEQKQLQCIAIESGGSYHDAEDAPGLLKSLKEALDASITETTLRVEVVGPDGSQVHTNVYLNEPGTDKRMSAYIAWKELWYRLGNIILS